MLIRDFGKSLSLTFKRLETEQVTRWRKRRFPNSYSNSYRPSNVKFESVSGTTTTATVTPVTPITSRVRVKRGRYICTKTHYAGRQRDTIKGKPYTCPHFEMKT